MRQQELKKEMRKFIEDSVNINTKRKVDGAVKKFRDWLKEDQDCTCLIEELVPDELNIYIGTWIKNLKKENSEEYEPDSITGFFRNVNTHLQNVGYDEDLLESPTFLMARQMVASKRKQLKGKGLGNKPNRCEAFTEEEENKLWELGLLGNETAESVQNTMWFFVTKCLGFRGRDESRKLKWGDLKLREDHAGVKFLEWIKERGTKTRDGNTGHTREFNPKLFENAKNKDRCPIAFYELIQEHRPLECLGDDSPFFLTINSRGCKSTEKKWYKNMPMGINTLGKIIKTMAEKAGIKGKKTNHSLRRTACSDLLNAGVAPTAIQQLTGHKNVQSVTNYVVADKYLQKEMCSILMNKGRPTDSHPRLALRASPSCPQSQQQQGPCPQPPLQPPLPLAHRHSCLLSSRTGLHSNSKTLTAMPAVVEHEHAYAKPPPKDQDPPSVMSVQNVHRTSSMPRPTCSATCSTSTCSASTSSPPSGQQFELTQHAQSTSSSVLSGLVNRTTITGGTFNINIVKGGSPRL